MRVNFYRAHYFLKLCIPLASMFSSFLIAILPASAAETTRQHSEDLKDPAEQKATAPYGQLKTFKFGTVATKTIWNLNEWPAGIPVCWENPTSENLRFRSMVQGAVAATWEKASLVRFVDWNTCSDSSRGIRIVFSDEGPHVKALGRYLDKMPHGMVLNTRFENWSPSCHDKRDFCLKAIAVHEFGHALGFAHEQNRSDAPPECQAERQGTDGDWNVTSYDPVSIMNYCNVNWNNSGQLSKRDIEAVQTIYGATQ